MINAAALGELLERTRTAMSLNQSEMAERTGIPQSSISRYEGSDLSHFPDPDVALKLKQGYGLSIEEMAATAGYDIEVSEVSPVEKRRILSEATLVEWIEVNYNDINKADAVRIAQTASQTIESMAEIVRAKENRK
jgi:transcriptional regulator with XRE-family HTH domain